MIGTIWQYIVKFSKGVKRLEIFLAKNIALPLLLRGVSAGPCFCLRVQHRKHPRRHVRPSDGLKVGPALTPRNDRLSSGKAMAKNQHTQRKFLNF